MSHKQNPLLLVRFQTPTAVLKSPPEEPTAPPALATPPAVTNNSGEIGLTIAGSGHAELTRPSGGTAPTALQPPPVVSFPSQLEPKHNPILATFTRPAAAATPPAVNRPVNRKIQICSIAQDGHSHREQALYEALWDAGRPAGNGDRLAALSVPVLAKKSYVHERNVPIITARLIAKRAIAIEAG